MKAPRLEEERETPRVKAPRLEAEREAPRETPRLEAPRLEEEREAPRLKAPRLERWQGSTWDQSAWREAYQHAPARFDPRPPLR